MPQYRYAFDDAQQVIDIFDLPQNRDEITNTFTCIACGTLLIAKTKGERRERNFAHKTRMTCNQETYLHKLAKHTFFAIYSQCLENSEPYHIMFTYPRMCDKYVNILGRRCTVGKLHKRHDLTEYYDAIKLEQRDDTFIPDVLIYDSTRPERKIYIEIAVTHFLSEEKKRSNNRIIEIPIEEESDIEKIRKRILSEEEASFVNFDRPSPVIPDEECGCAWKRYYCLFIYKNGKALLHDGILQDMESMRTKERDNVQYVSLTQSDHYYESRGKVFIQLVTEARQRGYPVRNCFICQYGGQNWDSFSNVPIYCRKFKKSCGSNAAVGCSSFWVLKGLE